MSSSHYDSAWVLRSRVLDEANESRLLRALLEAQKPDGSWGASPFYVHDRVVNTLSVLVALAATGSISARLGGSPRGRAVLRVVGGGALAMIVTYAVGALIGTAG